MSMTSSLFEKEEPQQKVAKTDEKPLVLIITGPTGIGKSSLAYELCKPNSHITKHIREGHIINADSIQVYEKVQIGANKPTLEELRSTTHHLIDFKSPTNDSYSAANWMNDVTCTLSQLDGAHVLPVIVGGTMMYLDWIVHGRPDATKPTNEAVHKAKLLVDEFQTFENSWEAAIEYADKNLSQIFLSRAKELSKHDWYRYRRMLEVAFTYGNHENLHEILYTGERTNNLSSLGYDVRCFFLCPSNRFQHAHILNERCEDMLIKGLLSETADLLCLESDLNKQITSSIGYRQTIDYLTRSHAKEDDEETFDLFIENFMTSTRQYAKKQMAWFRKDPLFYFLTIDLNSTDKLVKAIQEIKTLSQMNRLDYEECINGTLNQQRKDENQRQGKEMKVFMSKSKQIIKGTKVYNDMLTFADKCTKRVQQSNSLERKL